MATESPSTYKPTADAYTGMLTISLIALITGCVLLYLDFSQYPEGNPKKPNPFAPAPKVDAVPPPATDGEPKDQPAKDEPAKDAPAKDAPAKDAEMKDKEPEKDKEPAKDEEKKVFFQQPGILPSAMAPPATERYLRILGRRPEAHSEIAPPPFTRFAPPRIEAS